MNIWIDFLLFAVLPASLTWLYAGLAWSGHYRRWVRAVTPIGIPPIASWHKRNYWPLVTGVFGTGWILYCLFTIIDRHYPSLEWLGEILFYLGAALVVVACCWWPESLRPQWHKDWVARGGDRDRTGTPLLSDEELIARGKLPHGAAEKIQRQQARAARKTRR